MAAVCHVPLSRGLCAVLAERLILKEGSRMSDHRGSISGLTDDEAKEFHQFYVQGLVGFTAIAVIAHILVWAWRPWFY